MHSTASLSLGAGHAERLLRRKGRASQWRLSGFSHSGVAIRPPVQIFAPAPPILTPFWYRAGIDIRPAVAYTSHASVAPLLLCIQTEAMNPGCANLDACGQEERVA